MKSQDRVVSHSQRSYRSRVTKDAQCNRMVPERGLERALQLAAWARRWVVSVSLQEQSAQGEGRWEDAKGTIFPLPDPGQRAPELQGGGVDLQRGSLQEWEPALADI